MGAIDPIDKLLESVGLAEERVEEFRAELLECVLPSFNQVVQDAIAALKKPTEREIQSAIAKIELKDVPGLEDCLRSIYDRSFKAGEKEAEENIQELDLPSPSFIEEKVDQFQDLTAAELELVDDLIEEWFRLVQGEMVGQIQSLFSEIAESNPPGNELDTIVSQLEGFGVNVPSVLNVPDDPVISLQGTTLTQVSTEEALAWIDQEITRRAAIVERTGRGAADVIDQEASKKAKQKVYEEDPRVSAIQLVAVIDDGTTPICQGLNGTIMDTEDPDWKSGRYVPPFHFNCRTEPVPLGLLDPEQVNMDTRENHRVSEEDTVRNYFASGREMVPNPGGGIAEPERTLQGHISSGRQAPGGFTSRTEVEKLTDAAEEP